MAALTTNPPIAGVPLEFLHTKAPALARDIAMEIDTASALARGYGLNDDQWLLLRTSPWFKTLVTDTMTALAGADGTQERIRRKAGLAVEQAIPEVFGIITDPKATATARVAAFDSLKEAAGVKNNSTVAAAPAQFLLNISFPGAPERDVRVVATQAQALEHEDLEYGDPA